MNKNQKKRLIKSGIILLIAIVCILFEKLGRSEVSLSNDIDGEYGYVHFIDAGQGDCTLIETSDGKFALIDASTQSACDKIISYLENEGVKELEFVLFTHPHEDHIGCGDEVIDNFIVRTIYMNDKTENTACFRNLIEAAKKSKTENGTKVIIPKESDVFSLSDIDFTVLSDGSLFDDLNSSSICLKMEQGKSTFIFTGDAEKKVEKYILEGGESISAEVYKSAHHGSSTSNSSSFLDAINPDLAVTSCGKDNDYGHPHREVTEDFENRGIIHKRTDLDGDIVVAFNEEQIMIL